MFCNNNIRVFTEKYGRSFENLLSQIYSKHLYFSFSVLRGCFRRQQNSHKFSKFSTRFRNHFHTLLLRTETQFSHHVGEQGSTWWRLFVCRNEISAAKTCNFNFRPIVYRPSRLFIDRESRDSTSNICEQDAETKTGQPPPMSRSPTNVYISLLDFLSKYSESFVIKFE